MGERGAPLRLTVHCRGLPVRPVPSIAGWQRSPASFLPSPATGLIRFRRFGLLGSLQRAQAQKCVKMVVRKSKHRLHAEAAKQKQTPGTSQIILTFCHNGKDTRHANPFGSQLRPPHPPNPNCSTQLPNRITGNSIHWTHHDQQRFTAGVPAAAATPDKDGPRPASSQTPSRPATPEAVGPAPPSA